MAASNPLFLPHHLTSTRYAACAWDCPSTSQKMQKMPLSSPSWNSLSLSSATATATASCQGTYRGDNLGMGGGGETNYMYTFKSLILTYLASQPSPPSHQGCSVPLTNAPYISCAGGSFVEQHVVKVHIGLIMGGGNEPYKASNIVSNFAYTRPAQS